jgi:hypothetical protein
MLIAAPFGIITMNGYNTCGIGVGTGGGGGGFTTTTGPEPPTRHFCSSFVNVYERKIDLSFTFMLLIFYVNLPK